MRPAQSKILCPGTNYRVKKHLEKVQMSYQASSAVTPKYADPKDTGYGYRVTADETHSKLIGYILWIFGFTGSHRFYYGKPLSGTIWFFTFGLLGIGWLIDVFLIPGMDREAAFRFQAGPVDYSVAWILLTFLGALGIHRFFMGKIGTGIVYLLTGGLLGLGVLYDFLTLNTQISEINHRRLAR
jgi:TM2 domain-containing membrane protein YozV